MIEPYTSVQSYRTSGSVGLDPTDHATPRTSPNHETKVRLEAKTCSRAPRRSVHRPFPVPHQTIGIGEKVRTPPEDDRVRVRRRPVVPVLTVANPFHRPSGSGFRQPHCTAGRPCFVLFFGRHTLHRATECTPKISCFHGFGRLGATILEVREPRRAERQRVDQPRAPQPRRNVCDRWHSIWNSTMYFLLITCDVQLFKAFVAYVWLMPPTVVTHDWRLHAVCRCRDPGKKDHGLRGSTRTRLHRLFGDPEHRW